MYLKSRTYYRGTGQCAARGPFLMLVQPETPKDWYEKGITFGQWLRDNPPRALVRQVAMSQCGQFMMGSARVYGKTIILSGPFGGDGLPVNVSMDVYQRAAPLPEDIYAAWNQDDNATVRAWAMAHIAELQPAKH